MIAEVKIIMDCPYHITGQHQFEDYLKKKLKAKRVIVYSWKMGFVDD